MTLSFPPDVFSRIEPEIYLQRHLALGLRPVEGLRKFDEFRPVKAQLGPLNDDNDNIVGSALIKVGGTTVICGISLSTSETGPGGVYPNVEIVRGGGSRNAPPTQEEMMLSQQAYNSLSTQLAPSYFQHENLPDLHIVLNASVQVLSRTGPCYDAVWSCIVAALQDTRLPRLDLDPDTKQVVVAEDEEPQHFLRSHGVSLSHSTTFGVAEMDRHQDDNGDVEAERKLAVVADLEGDTEESCISSRIQLSSSADGYLTGASIRVVGSTASGGRSGIRLSRDHVQHAMRLAQSQAAVLDGVLCD